MAREISLLIPDEYDDENLEIRVLSSKKEILQFRLELIEFDQDDSNMSRADFVKKKIDGYDPNYLLMDVGVDDYKIPLLFKSINAQEEDNK